MNSIDPVASSDPSAARGIRRWIWPDSASFPQTWGDFAPWLCSQVLMLQAIALCITVIISGIQGHHFGTAFVFSSCISLSCGFFIQCGRWLANQWLSRRPNTRLTADELRGAWPGWPLMLLILIVGTALGVSLGNAVANALTGLNEPGLHDSKLSTMLGLMQFSLIPGLAFTGYFVIRSRLAHAEMRAQTAQRLAAENQLRLLESQLEPHMLFNTLANLRVLIGMDPPRAQAMLDQLIAFLRATLQASRSSAHPLSAEFARLQDYLALMQVRMGPRLQATLTLPPELATHNLPPLLLQPLVENAIKHGLEPHVDGGALEISAQRQGEQLVLQVRDTGAGLGNSPHSGTQFGLQQVRERLQAQYGEAAALHMANASDGRGGTLATITLPFAEAAAPTAS